MASGDRPQGDLPATSVAWGEAPVESGAAQLIQREPDS
jgi:hypothetical protein